MTRMQLAATKRRQCGAITAILLATQVLACGGGGGTPTSPSSSLQISNLRNRELGFDTAICGGNIFQTYKVWDEVVFDYRGAREQDLIATNVFYKDVDGRFVSFAHGADAARECRLDASPCSNPNVCLLSRAGSSGTMRAWVATRWRPSWNLEMHMSVSKDGVGVDSNSLTTTVSRTTPPEGVPIGETAAILSLTATRVSFSFVAYSPGIAGRTVEMTLAWRPAGQPPPGTRLPFIGVPAPESPNTPVVSVAGGYIGTTFPPGPVDITAELTERDASGTILANESRTVRVP